MQAQARCAEAAATLHGHGDDACRRRGREYGIDEPKETEQPIIDALEDARHIARKLSTLRLAEFAFLLENYLYWFAMAVDDQFISLAKVGSSLVLPRWRCFALDA